MRKQDLTAIAIVGLLIAMRGAWAVKDRFISGTNDFLAFYAGARLAGTPDLYNMEKAQGVQKRSLGMFGENLGFIRLPYLAGILSPLARLPYTTAYWLFQASSLLALAMAVWLWPGHPGYKVLGAASLFPTWVILLTGHDTFFLVLWVSVGLWLHSRGRDFEAGVALSLCLAKPHLFIFLPLLLAVQRRWRIFAGAAAGASCLLVVSFAICPDWPRGLYRILTTQPVSPCPTCMVNLVGLTANLGATQSFRWGLALLASSLVMLTAWRLRQQPAALPSGVLAVILGGILVNSHSYIGDCVLFLPFLGLVPLAVAPIWLAILAPSPWPALVPAFLVGVLGWLSLRSLGQRELEHSERGGVKIPGAPEHDDSSPA